MIRLLGIALTASVCAMLCRGAGKEWEVLIGTAGAAVLLCAVLSELSPVLLTLGGWLGEGELSEWLSSALKGTGVCLVTEFGAQFCRDAGEAGVAKALEWAGRAAILTLCLPLMKRLIELAGEMIG